MLFYEETTADFKIHMSNYSSWPKPVASHIHTYYELYFLLDGSIKYFIGDSFYFLKSNDIVLIPPNIFHRTRPDATEKHSRILLNFAPSFIKKLFNDEDGSTDIFNKVCLFHPNQQEQNVIRYIAGKMLEKYKESPTIYPSFLSSHLSVLLYTLKECISSSDPLIPQKNDVPETLCSIIHYINSSYFNEITLSTLSQKFYLHPTYISNLIKKELGMTFTEYLTRIRIVKSLQLLQGNKHKIEEIASICGFNSSSRYSKVFSSYFKMSPLKYKKEVLNDPNKQ